MESLNELLTKAEAAHGHLCAGQILGVRMALLALARLGITDPRGADRKRLVTGCRLGKRTLKFRDWGKMAATFVDLATGSAVRVVALESSRDLARQLHPEIESKSQQQMQAYRELADDQLFRADWVEVQVDPAELPGQRGERLLCPRCGEGINFGRFVDQDGERLCISCAHPGLRYWRPAATPR